MATTRKVMADDVPALKAILDSSGLFPSEYLDDMIAPYLSGADSEAIWFVATDEQRQPTGFGYCVPEQLTNGTFNLLAIAVHKPLQGSGIGKQLMAYIENHLTEQGKRILIVETSGSDQFVLTRTFYIKNGYTAMATIKDFWNEGEDKIIFWKKLN